MKEIFLSILLQASTPAAQFRFTLLLSEAAALLPLGFAQDSDSPVALIVGAIDPSLKAQKFIVPGLGDFADRYFQTR